MPGSNCSVFGCGTCRNQSDIGIFKIPAPKDEFHTKWRNDLLAAVTRDRVLDENLKKQIKNNKVPICEKHFNSDQIYFYPTRKLLKEGAMQTLNLPEKSHPSKITVRSCSVTDKRDICKQLTPQISIPAYKDFSDFIRKVKSLKLNGWIATFNNEYAKFEKLNPDFVVPSHEIYVDQTLNFTILIYGWQLPINHQIYTEHSRSLKYIAITRMINEVEGFILCCGISVLDGENWNHLKRHVIPKTFHFPIGEVFEKCAQQEYIRNVDCEMILMARESSCKACFKSQITERKKINRKKKVLATPAKLNAPVTMTSPERLLLTIRGQRNENRELHIIILILFEVDILTFTKQF